MYGFTSSTGEPSTASSPFTRSTFPSTFSSRTTETSTGVKRRLGAAHVRRHQVGPEQDVDVRIAVQPQERLRQLRPQDNARPDVLPAVGHRPLDAVPDDADGPHGDLGQVGQFIAATEEEAADAVQHLSLPPLSPRWPR